jgi:hypothetical protein
MTALKIYFRVRVYGRNAPTRIDVAENYHVSNVSERRRIVPYF